MYGVEKREKRSPWRQFEVMTKNLVPCLVVPQSGMFSGLMMVSLVARDNASS